MIGLVPVVHDKYVEESIRVEISHYCVLGIGNVIDNVASHDPDECSRAVIGIQMVCAALVHHKQVDEPVAVHVTEHHCLCV